MFDCRGNADDKERKFVGSKTNQTLNSTQSMILSLKAELGWEVLKTKLEHKAIPEHEQKAREAESAPAVVKDFQNLKFFL